MSRSPKLPPLVPPRHESAYWEARARVMWGQSRADVRQWLEGHPIAPADIEAMLDLCFAERAQVMRGKGLGDLLVAALVMLPSIAGLILWSGISWVFGSGSLLVVYGCLRLFRGIARVALGAKALGSVADSADDLGPWWEWWIW